MQYSIKVHTPLPGLAFLVGVTAILGSSGHLPEIRYHKNYRRKGMYCNLDSQPCSHCQMFTTTTAQRVMVSYCFALCLYVYSSNYYSLLLRLIYQGGRTYPALFFTSPPLGSEPFQCPFNVVEIARE